MHNNLFLRLISAVILTPIVLAVIVCGGIYSEFSYVYDIFLAIVGCLMATEWNRMITGKEDWVSACLTLMSCGIIGFVYINPFVSIIFIPLAALFLYLKTRNILLSFGAFYIGIPMLALMYIAYFTDSGDGDLSYSYMYILWLLFVVWSTDIGAYVVGKTVGGPKMSPIISPKKTWSGFFGGLLFSAITAYVFVTSVHYFDESQLSMGALVLSSVGLSFIAQMGDLFESKIKRHLGIKDSGNLIPGHGGIFDRVDSLLFAAPVVALFVFLMNMGCFHK